MDILTYTEGRDKIKSGDIVAFHTDHRSPIGPQIVTFFTGFSVYHVGVAVWLYSSAGDRRLFIVEANKGNRQIVPLSLYAGERMDIYTPPVKFDLFSETLLARVGNIKYSWFDLPKIWVREKFGINCNNSKGEVCSEMIVHIFKESGVQFSTDVISPGKLVNEMRNNGFELTIKINNI